jgi:hypothetical protein
MPRNQNGFGGVIFASGNPLSITPLFMANDVEEDLE